MDPPEKIFSFTYEENKEEESQESQDEKKLPDAPKKSTLMDHIGNSTEATIIAILVIVCALVYFYWSTKGMCKFTENDGFFVTIMKHFLNYFTAGVIGVTSFFIENKKK